MACCLISFSKGMAAQVPSSNLYARSNYGAACTSMPSLHLQQVFWNQATPPKYQTFCSSIPDMYRKKANRLGLSLVAKDIDELSTKNEEEQEVDGEKSEVYSDTMSKAMGADLLYRHELGMNYNFVLPNLIVGSCLQDVSDVDKLSNLGVGTVFCLQQDPDLAYFDVDISAIQRHAEEVDGIEHIRAPIQDFDAFDLRARLPAVISKLHKAVLRNGGITYIHCTAGLGRAPAVTLTYMHWLLGYQLNEANAMLQNVRPCFPKLEAIRNATCDMLCDRRKETVVLQWQKGTPESVEVSGLDIGWGQRVALTDSESTGCWNLTRTLPVGKYEYKYIIDGEWVCNLDEPVTEPNKDGHVNNYVEVVGDLDNEVEQGLSERLMSEDGNLTDEDRRKILEKLMAMDES